MNTLEIPMTLNAGDFGEDVNNHDQQIKNQENRSFGQKL
jgi:hypothetical protein